MDKCIVVVLIIQVVSWMLVTALLFAKGVDNLQKGQNQFNISILNSSIVHSEEVVLKGYTSGIILLIIATVMIIIGPTFLVLVIIEKCYRKQKFKKLPHEDLPPRYEDVVLEETAPRYSSLFLNMEDEGTE